MRSQIALVMSGMVFSAAACCAQDSSADALKLLDQVSAHYRDAEYLHLEFEVRTVSHSPRRDSSDTGTYSVTLAPGGRFRYQGENSSGSGVLVSDGTDEWRLMASFPEWAKEPAGSFFNSRALVASDNSALLTARDDANWLRGLDAGIQSAHFQPEEVLEDHGKRVRCEVIRFGPQDTNRRLDPGADWHTTVWIDPAKLRILRIERGTHGHYYFAPETPLNGPFIDTVQTMNVTLSDFAFEPKADTFVFTPPVGAKEVAKLPTGLIGAPPPASDFKAKEAAAHVGKPLPEVILKDATGADVSFSRYRGHPLLIDVWATWCGPCISEMPALQHIRKSTSGTDLQMIAVDQDLHSSDAVALLKQRGYDWPDFAYTVPFVRALSISGIPLLVLVNAEGTVVYYHSGADDAKGLAEAIAKLGPAYASVRID